jgi:hypothetical protein
MHFEKKTEKVDLTVTVTYCLSGKKCDVIYEVVRTLTYRE